MKWFKFKKGCLLVKTHTQQTFIKNTNRLWCKLTILSSWIKSGTLLEKTSIKIFNYLW